MSLLFESFACHVCMLVQNSLFVVGESLFVFRKVDFLRIQQKVVCILSATDTTGSV